MPSLLQRQIFKEIANLFVLAVGVLLTLILISRSLRTKTHTHPLPSRN